MAHYTDKEHTTACWSKCYELQAAGFIPDDLLAEMPELVA